MTYVVNGACIGTKDLSCLDVCPVDCIYEIDEMVVIEPSECIDCALCEPVCPVDAITPAEGVPADQRAFIAINAAWGDGASEVERLLAEHQASSG